MKKVAISGAIIIALLGAVVGFAYWQNTQEADRQNAEQAAVTSESLDEPEATVEENESVDQPATFEPIKGSYADYSEASFANAEGQRVLFFHAPWCPQCRSIDEGITGDNVPEGISLFKIDYDSNQSLRQKYDVTLQTSFVAVDENGELVKKFVAYNEPTFDAVKRDFLNEL